MSRPFVAVRWLISHTRRPEMAGQTRCLGRRCNDEDEKKCIAQYTKARVNALYKHQLLQKVSLAFTSLSLGRTPDEVMGEHKLLRSLVHSFFFLSFLAWIIILTYFPA